MMVKRCADFYTRKRVTGAAERVGRGVGRDVGRDVVCTGDGARDARGSYGSSRNSGMSLRHRSSSLYTSGGFVRRKYHMRLCAGAVYGDAVVA